MSSWPWNFKYFIIILLQEKPVEPIYEQKVPEVTNNKKKKRPRRQPTPRPGGQSYVSTVSCESLLKLFTRGLNLIFTEE